MRLSLVLLLNLFFVFAHAQETIPASIYDFKVPAAKGGIIDMSLYRGKKILIVNTPQDGANNPYYNELEKLYKENMDKLVIIGFLDEDFGIPPGTNKTKQPVQREYTVTFPLAARVMVRGENMAPIYKWLTNQKYNKLQDNEVAWDFQKYLINEQGSLIAVFEPKLRPDNPKIIAAIKQ